MILTCLTTTSYGQSGNIDWVGWAYFDDGSDLPLRVGLPDPPAVTPATFDFLVGRRFNDSISELTWRDSTLRFVYTTSKGTHVVFEGVRSDSIIDGTLLWGDSPGAFELTRSPRSLPDIDPERFLDCEGIYRSGTSDVYQVTARFWGELVFTERHSGLRRTLFPITDSTFFVGPAMYVPVPIAGHVTFHRSTTGAVTGLTWKRIDGVPLFAEQFEITEEEVSFTRDTVTFHGTLLREAGSQRLPGIVMLGGSSWETRKATRFRGAMLASLGFAALIYDKRGYGESNGDQTVPFAVTADDGLAAARYLRSRDDVRRDQVGLFGASRGGWFAPLAASRSDSVAFLILLVPPAVSPAVQETHSRLDQMRDEGYGQDDLNRASQFLDANWEFARTGRNWDSYWALWQECHERGYPDYLLGPDVPDSSEWEWGRMNMFYDPIPALRNVTCPVLAIFGEKDLYVSTVMNRPLMEQALRDAGNTDVSLHTMPGVGHNLSETDDLPLHRRSGHGDEGYSIIADWIDHRFE